MFINKRIVLSFIFIGGLALLVIAYLFYGIHRVAKDNVPAESSMTNNASAHEKNNTLFNSPQARAYRQREQFENDIKVFLRDAKQMQALARDLQAQQLQQQIEQYEKLKQMSAGEAYLLKTAMIKATVLDEQALQSALIDLTARYQADTERREAAWLAQQQQNPQFQAYKARESEIVAEVMAMTSIPGQLSRDEYLRQRLQQERERQFP
jgi:hypothetical protein